jgi:hypothetical protein
MRNYSSQLYTGNMSTQVPKHPSTQQGQTFAVPHLDRGSTLVLLASLAAGFTALAPSSAHAALTLSFNTPYNGDVPNASNGQPISPTNPGLTATFTDLLTPGQVELKLQAILPFNQYIDGLAFNLADSFLPSALSVFSCTAPGNICTTYGSTFPSAQNTIALQGNGNGNGFDFKFAFANAGSDGGFLRFNGQELVTLVLQASGLTAQSFNYKNSPTPQGSQYVGFGGAKINGILPSGSGAVGAGGGIVVFNGNTNSVPGPLPILGVWTALAYSRRLRSRIRSTRHPLDTGTSS